MTGPALGILGGTFDPIHVGHLAVAADVAEQLRLDRVLFVPTGDSYQKSSFSPAAERAAMVRLAVADNPRFAVSTVDIDRPGPTYTADTVADLTEQHPGARLFFLLGADALAGFASWQRTAEILALATLVAVERPGVSAPQDVPALRVTGPHLDISATELRQRVAAGRTIRYLVPPAVADHIAAARLYTKAGARPHPEAVSEAAAPTYPNDEQGE